MTAINLSLVVPVGDVLTTPSTARPTVDSSLLPDPQPDTRLDAMSELYALMSEQRRVGAEKSKSDAEGVLEKKKLARERALAAVKKAEAEEEDGGVFGDIGKRLGTVGKVAAIVGAAAVVVGTGGRLPADAQAKLTSDFRQVERFKEYAVHLRQR